LSKPSILHIAPENTAGVPYNLMKMQRMFGFDSRLCAETPAFAETLRAGRHSGVQARLISFYKIPFDFPEDICLNLSLPRNKLAMKWRELKQSKLHDKIKENKIDKWTHMPYFDEGNAAEKIYRRNRERKNSPVFEKALKEIAAENFDVFHFDGGIDFYSDCRFAKKMKQAGKKIVNCYYGDDLRTRGIVKEMDEMSDLNLTFEYDHTLRHPKINFLFFPFEQDSIRFIDDETYHTDLDKGKLRIIHSPTHRFIKGTQEIIEAIEKVKANREIEFVLIENMLREKLIDLKRTCHVAIDQIGNRGGTGYGINSLENLSMGLPTITDMNCGMDTWLPKNPFVVANKDNLAETLIEIIDNKEKYFSNRNLLRDWVVKYHSYQSVMTKLSEYYKANNIL